MNVYFTPYDDAPGRWLWEYRWNVLTPGYTPIGEMYAVTYNPSYIRIGEWWDGYVTLDRPGQSTLKQYFTGNGMAEAIEHLLAQVGWKWVK